MCVAALLGGCGKPNQANIALRKQIQDLQQELAGVRQAREADQARLRGLEARATTVPTLPQEQLDRLVTTHGLQIGRLSGGADLDPAKSGDEGLKVYVVPIDIEGDPIKAAGEFTVEAFDLSDPANPLIGRWTFDGRQKELWYSELMLYNFVLPCPWQHRVPGDEKLTVRVTFVDELTQRQFTAQKVVPVRPPPAPATGAAADVD